MPVDGQGIVKKIRVLVADDHRLILEAVRRSLGAAEDIEIVGEARSGAQVLPLVQSTEPDLVLLDLRMPGMDGLAVPRRDPASATPTSRS